MTKVLILIAVMLSLASLAPLATIWSINTLFQLGISYTIETWLAVVWLSTVTFGSVSYAINNLKK
jgi:hypothetical protein